jgi:hypothetical protein
MTHRHGGLFPPECSRWAIASGNRRSGAPGPAPLVASFPVDPYTKFGRYPLLLGSVDSDGQPTPRDELARFRWATGELRADDIVLLMTDVLAEWLLASSEHTPLLAGAAWPDVERAITTAR